MRTISVAHSFFGFDMFFLVKGIRLSAWGAEDINIGRTGLTNINFAGISSQVNFIDTMKYFLTSLGQLVSTLDEVEKARLKKLTLQFLNLENIKRMAKGKTFRYQCQRKRDNYI